MTLEYGGNWTWGEESSEKSTDRVTTDLTYYGFATSSLAKNWMQRKSKYTVCPILENPKIITEEAMVIFDSPEFTHRGYVLILICNWANYKWALTKQYKADRMSKWLEMRLENHGLIKKSLVKVMVSNRRNGPNTDHSTPST